MCVQINYLLVNNHMMVATARRRRERRREEVLVVGLARGHVSSKTQFWGAGGREAGPSGNRAVCGAGAC